MAASRVGGGYRRPSGPAILLLVELPAKQIFYGEFDGQRRKRVLVKVIGE